MASWQIMQVFTLGSPAKGPFVALSWQYSVQVSPFSMCRLCGNAIGWTGARRMSKNSRAACATVGRAVVNVVDDSWAESVDPHAVSASADTTTPAVKTVRNRSITFGIQSPERRCRNGHRVYLAWMLRR